MKKKKEPKNNYFSPWGVYIVQKIGLLLKAFFISIKFIFQFFSILSWYFESIWNCWGDLRSERKADVEKKINILLEFFIYVCLLSNYFAFVSQYPSLPHNL